jgi:S-(hydroxymethyl)glutathione dehydrogenase/alcohol dehydrogenase
MGMRSRAVVLRRFDDVPEVEEIEVAPPGRGEVLVRVVNAGVCRSELPAIRGKRALPLPIVLGHEGAGIVERVGEDVRAVKPGDRVVLIWRAPCGRCPSCAIGRPALCEEAARASAAGSMPDGTLRFSQDGKPVHHFLTTSCFQEYTVVHEKAVIPIPADFPPAVAAIMGCAVMTGVGAVVNTARVRAGSTVAVFGAGGVGLSVILGARLMNARTIVAVDIKDEKLETALSLGATDAVNAARVDPVKAIRDLTGGRGVEYAFEVIGLGKVFEQAFEATGRAGTTTMVGSPAPDDSITLSARLLYSQERTVKACYYGSTRFYADIPWLVGLYRAGTLPIDRLVSRHYPLDRYGEALRALEAGEVARSVLDVTPA